MKSGQNSDSFIGDMASVRWKSDWVTLALWAQTSHISKLLLFILFTKMLIPLNRFTN